MVIGNFRVESKNQRYVSADVIENFVELVDVSEVSTGRPIRVNINSLSSIDADNIQIGKVYKFELTEVVK